jgi:hypothetical protein
MRACSSRHNKPPVANRRHGYHRGRAGFHIGTRRRWPGCRSR